MVKDPFGIFFSSKIVLVDNERPSSLWDCLTLWQMQQVPSFLAVPRQGLIRTPHFVQESVTSG